MLNTLFPPWPSFTTEEAEAVSNVLLSNKVNYWTGTEGHAFEQEFADFCHARHAIALANGTVALELALAAMGVGPGDEVITTARTFIASASCVVMRGATPIIADIDPTSQNITAETIRPLITPRTKAIIAVHLAGWPCDMDPILSLAAEKGLKVIEDCAQAHGAMYKGRPVGSLGDAAAFSFCQDKIMTTGGEGGMLTTNDYQLWEKAWAFKDHGKNYDTVFRRKQPPGFRWLHESFGTNWRMTEMQSAIGRIQLRRLVAARRHHAAFLNQELASVPAIRLTIPPEDFFHSYYKYYFFLRPELIKKDWSRDRIIQAINECGVPCFSGSCSEIYREKAFSNKGLGPTRSLPVAHELGETSLMVMVHPTLAMEHLEKTLHAVKKIFNEATQ